MGGQLEQAKNELQEVQELRPSNGRANLPDDSVPEGIS